MSSRARNETEACGPPVDQGPTDAEREAEIERMIALGVHPRVARGLRRQEEGDHGSEDSTDEKWDPWLAGRGPRFAPSGTVPIRATSNGGDFVRYSSQTSPVPAHEPKAESPSVVVAVERQGDADRNASTVVIDRVKRQGIFAWIFRNHRRFIARRIDDPQAPIPGAESAPDKARRRP
jgi:hypothetical protein